MDDPGPLGAGATWWCRAAIWPRSPRRSIPAASSADDLRDSHWRFRLVGYLTRKDGEVHAGEFAFPAHASLRTVFAVLRTGQPVQHHVTIPEGLTAPQVVAVLARAEALSGADAPLAEGSVLPQTYAYTYGTPRAAIWRAAASAPWTGRSIRPGRTGHPGCRWPRRAMR